MRRVTLAIALALSAVGSLVAPVSADQFHDRGPNPNPVLFAPSAEPYGFDMATWGERASQWIYGQPLEQSPLFDPTGANCGVAQQGPVWYIARIAGPPVFTGTRACSIPHDKSLFLYIGAVVDIYPCPDPTFQPAPGQSLYDFLAADAKALMDTVDLLEVSLDGRPLNDILGYRYASDDLFQIRGDLSLQSVFDPCITGDFQPAVVDGFFLMFKPLERGLHTIIVHGTNTFGHDKTFIYNLTIE
jgi:hypothetical protein